jgi:hypothetical protein
MHNLWIKRGTRNKSPRSLRLGAAAGFKRAEGASMRWRRTSSTGSTYFIVCKLNLNVVNLGMMFQFYAFWVLLSCSVIAFAVSLYAIARVRIITNTLGALDWETLANLTGEIGAMKRSLQKTNNRINGMTSSDPATVLSELPKFQMASQNVTPINKGG